MLNSLQYRTGSAKHNDSPQKQDNTQKQDSKNSEEQTELTDSVTEHDKPAFGGNDSNQPQPLSENEC